MKNNEIGRSMVEMLGVLAIIGVLSVAGIAGYTAAMKKNKVNNAAAELSMAAILGKTYDGGTGVTTSAVSCADLGVNGDRLVKVGISSANCTVEADSTNANIMKVTIKTLSSAGFACSDLETVVPTSKDKATRSGYYMSCTSAS